MGQQSTGSGSSKSVGQMTGKDSPSNVLSLPSDNVPNREQKLPSPAPAQKMENDKV